MRRKEAAWRLVDATSPSLPSQDLSPRNPEHMSAFRETHEEVERLTTLLINAARERAAVLSDQT